MKFLQNGHIQPQHAHFNKNKDPKLTIDSNSGREITDVIAREAAYDAGKGYYSIHAIFP